MSYLLGSTPAASYIWSNLLWLFFIAFFVGRMATLLGGSHWARVGAVLALFFGVNIVGYTLEWGFGSYLGKIMPLWIVSGDLRYTPWVLKFLFFNQMPFSLGMFVAVVFIAVKLPTEKLTADYLAIAGSLLVGIGLIYPIIFPAAASVVIAKIVTLLVDRRGKKEPGHTEWMGLCTVILIAGAITALHVGLVTQDRVIGAVQLSHPLRFARKTITGIVVTLPLLIGLTLALRGAWKRNPQRTLIALLSAAGSLGLNVAFRLNEGVANEYKYIFTTAICLAPFAGLALQRLFEQWGKWAFPLLASIGMVVAMPLVIKVYELRPRYWIPSNPPIVDAGKFDLRLAGGGELASLCDAIRLETSRNTILILENASVHFPTLTRRRLFVPPTNDNRAGVNINSDYLLHQTKGYDQKLIDHRRHVQSALFRTREWRAIEESLGEILQLKKPLAIVLDENRHRFLLERLSANQFGEIVYRGGKYVLWVVRPSVKGRDT